MSALERLQQQLQDTNALIIQFENSLTLPENKKEIRSLSANLKALHNMREHLEKQFLDLAALQEQEVYRYRIIETSERPSLGGIAEAWSKFQNLFSVVYSKLTKDEPPAPLGYSYCFAGSVGVVVTLPKLPAQSAALLTKNPIDDASEIVFDLIESKHLSQIVSDLGPEPIKAMNEWLAVHIEHQYGLGLEWKSERITKRDITVPYTQLATLQSFVEEATTETTLILNGEMVVVNTVKKTFQFNADDGQAIEGTYDAAITYQQSASVPFRYQATIKKTTKMILKDPKKDKPVTYFLESLGPTRAS
jgi:hypothetical protein